MKKIIIVVFICILLCACSKQSDKKNSNNRFSVESKEDEAESDSDELVGVVLGDYYTLFYPVDDDLPTITWAFETLSVDTGFMPQNALKAINDCLHQNNINYSLRFVLFDRPYDKVYNDDGKSIYETKLDKFEKEYGTVDILSCGTRNSQEEGAAFLESGYFLCLDDYLKTDEGKQLYMRFSELDWKMTSVGNHVFSIPMNNYQILSTSFSSIGFNSNYIKDITEFDGTFDSLLKLHEKYAKDKKIVFRNISDLRHMMGIEFWNGLVYDNKTKTFSDSLQNDLVNNTIGEFLQLLNPDGNEGFLCYKENSHYADDEIFAEFIYGGEYKKDSFVYYEYQPLDSSSKYFYTNGIRSASSNVETAEKILNMVYSDSGLPDLLLYGLDNDEVGDRTELIYKGFCFGCFQFTDNEDFVFPYNQNLYMNYYDKIDSPLIGFDAGLTMEEAKIIGAYNQLINQCLFYGFSELPDNDLGFKNVEDYSAAVAPIIDTLNRRMSK